MNKFFAAVLTSASLLSLGSAASAQGDAPPQEAVDSARKTRVEVDSEIEILLSSAKSEKTKRILLPVRSTYTEEPKQGQRYRIYSEFEDGSPGSFAHAVSVLIDEPGDFEVLCGRLPNGLEQALRAEKAAQDPIWKLLDGVPSDGRSHWEIPRALVTELLELKPANLATFKAFGRARDAGGRARSGDASRAEHLFVQATVTLEPGTSLGGVVLGAKNHLRMRITLDRSASGLTVKIRQHLTGPVLSIAGSPGKTPEDLTVRYTLKKTQTFTELTATDQTSGNEPWNHLLASFLPRRSAPKVGAAQLLGGH